ncbi:MAG: AzlD domain-containing protein [Oscillospiraceae bacterium]|nr:AzlD domain-containing protein [Oscillospiraceae bacterium]MBQ5340229.1 AzlD domain-containing protein [Oscillospiraceae bacterium]
MSRILIAIAVMALTTYIIRMVPFAFVRKKIKNRFIQSVLYYIPYAVLSAMTIPSIFYATQDLPSAIAGTVVAVVLAYFGCPLIVVALSASAAAYLTMLLLPLILQ